MFRFVLCKTSASTQLPSLSLLARIILAGDVSLPLRVQAANEGH